MPLPLHLEKDAALHVSAFQPVAPPEMAGVVGHRLRAVNNGLREWNGLMLSSPIHTWCLLGTQLSVPDLVAIGDFMITGDIPMATPPELVAAVDSWRGRSGARKLVAALPQVRIGPLSRPETLARLLIVAAGLPEPELNVKIYDDHGRFLAMGDLVWREARAIGEYEGDHHRTDPRQFRRDILRRERVEDHDWRLTRFTTDDICLRPAEFVARFVSRLGVVVSARGMARAIALSSEFVP